MLILRRQNYKLYNEYCKKVVEGNCLLHSEFLLMCKCIYEYNQDSCTLPHLTVLQPHSFLYSVLEQSCRCMHMLSVHAFLISQSHVYAHRCLRERESPLKWKSVCLKMKGFTPTAYMQSLFRHLPATVHTVAEATQAQHPYPHPSTPQHTRIPSFTPFFPYALCRRSSDTRATFREAHISSVAQRALRWISSHKSLWQSILVFPHRWCGTVGFQPWNMLSYTQGVKNDTDHDAR